MTAQPDPKRRYTLEEYYEMENADQSGAKHEFHDGYIVPAGGPLAMAGGTVEHSQICTNLLGELRQRLKGSPCQALESNLRSRIEQSSRIVYPDVTVVCSPIERDQRDKSDGTILNPRVVIEVLSPSTEKYDRVKKRDHYLKIPTLVTHVLVEQTEARVETLTRTADGRWELDYAEGLERTLKLPTLNVEIPLREIYDRVEFPPAIYPPADDA